MSEAAPANHRIRDEIIELYADDAELAQDLLERVSLVHRRELVAVIDRVCSQHSPGDRVHRIDTLELDLGAIDADDFEAELVRRFELALRRELSRTIRDLDLEPSDTDAAGRAAPDRREPGAALELLELFLLTGNLPWWADRSRPGLVAEQLARAAAAQPRALLQLLGQVVDSGRPEPLRRLIRQLDDDERAALVEALGSGSSDTGRTLAAVGRWLARLVDDRGEAAWRAVVGAVVLSSGSSAEVTVDAALEQLAVELGVPVRELCTTLDARVARAEHDCPQVLRAALERAASPAERGRPDPEPTPEPPDPPAAAASEADAELAVLLDTWRSEAGPLRALADRLGPIHARARARPASDRGASAHDRLRSLVEQALREGSLSAPALRPALAQLRTEARAHADAIEDALMQAVDQAALRGREPEPPPERARPPARELLPDQLHVDDAGCVIAWPFFERLFTRLELVDPTRKSFVDPAAASRATALVHVLASEDADPPEYALPLAKLLCGLDPDAPFELETPLQPAELDECEQMLEALIGHATILRDMSVAGLRSSFLRREGILGRRDGAWLLQVERRTHDVVLDRFAWTWTWVRLPWMAAPLRVEW